MPLTQFPFGFEALLKGQSLQLGLGSEWPYG